MVSTYTNKRYGALCIIALLTHALFAAAPDQPAPAGPPDWRQSALQEIKAPDYYYALLDIANEDEFATAAAADPARDRATILREKLAARINSIDNPTPLSGPGEREYVLEELQNAARLLNNTDITRLYGLLGHATYTSIQETHPPLLAAFTGKNVPSILKMTAQFLKSLGLEKSSEDAFIDANKPELLSRHAAANIPDTDRTLADALGGILYESLDDNNKAALQEFIAAHPIDPAGITIPYKNNILKEYIRLLQCKLAGPACKKPDTQTKKAEDKSKDKTADDKKDEKATTAPLDNKKIIEELEKVKAKLEGFALPGIQQAKRYLTRVKADERKFIKSEVARVLDDNKDLKIVADAIRNSPIPQYQEFAKVVDAIYKEAGGF